MKYAVKMSSGAMIYTPTFIKMGSDTQKMIGGIYRHTVTVSKVIPSAYFNFFKQESRLTSDFLDKPDVQGKI
jgi:hypothetical protein